MRNPMLDEDFLKRLDKFKHRFIWTKIIALNIEEDPVDEVSGRVTSGSINIDGSSAVRRTCSLTFVAEHADINNFYWGLNTKFRVFIGLENHIDNRYPDIIWFNQGVFIITSFGCNETVNSYTISISGRDKMALLNGDLGGVIPASWDFGSMDETQDDGSIKNTLIPIKDIVLQMVHEYAQEPWQNIIVNDLDDLGVEILEYIGKNPLYLFRFESYLNKEGSEVAFTDLKLQAYDGEDECQIYREGGSWETIKISEIDKDYGDGYKYSYDKNIGKLSLNDKVPISKSTYYPAKIRMKLASSEKIADSKDGYIYGAVMRVQSNDGTQVCGYRETEIVYPYDLIAAPGETVVSVLDKLVKMLGDFEYFYDVDGRFIFQRKKIYQNVSYNNLINERHGIKEETWADSDQFNSKYAYIFDDSELVMSVQNSPNLSNIKNDYSLWGVRDANGVSVPIHARYAIDHKPMWYKTFDGMIYCTQEGMDEYKKVIADWDRLSSTIENNSIMDYTLDTYKIVDWREIIYQMAQDYRCHYREDDFLIELRDNNKWTPRDWLYPKGYTGYERYYIDFEMNLSQGVIAYWRELYNSECILTDEEKTDGATYTRGEYLSNQKFRKEREIQDWDPNSSYKVDDVVWGTVQVKEENSQGVTELVDKRYYFTCIKAVSAPAKDESPISYKNTEYWAQGSETYGSFIYDADGWNAQIFTNPEMLNFWFDFLDTTGELNKYSIPNIGLRSKATNDDKIKAIYFRDIPNIIFYEPDKQPEKIGYTYFQLPKNREDQFIISARGKCAMDVIDEYLYDYTYPASAVSLTTVPIYHLSPNTLIYINDKETGIVGEYIAQKFSYQLGLSAQMSISAVETAKRIY